MQLKFCLQNVGYFIHTWMYQTSFLKSEITFKHIGEQTKWESFSSLISGEYGYYLELVISRIDFLSISCENAMKQMPQDLNDHKLTLI